MILTKQQQQRRWQKQRRWQQQQRRWQQHRTASWLYYLWTTSSSWTQSIKFIKEDNTRRRVSCPLKNLSDGTFALSNILTIVTNICINAPSIYTIIYIFICKIPWYHGVSINLIYSLHSSIYISICHFLFCIFVFYFFTCFSF